jgi:predicted dehydrogenase
MATFERIRAGVIGYGIGKIYTATLRNVGLYYPDFPGVDLVAISTASDASGEKAVQQFGFERRTTDYRDLLAADDINVLVIATPNHLHHEMMLNALQTDKAIYFDKPLANNLTEAREILAASRQTGRDAQIIFEFRFAPATQIAHQMIQDGRLGDIYTFRATYFRSSYIDPQKPLRWKASLAQSGGGSTQDLTSHILDLVIRLVGMPERVSAQLRTFIHERPAARGSAEKAPVETDDHATLLCAMPGGTIGTVEAGRLLTGAQNDLAIEVYGSQGSLKWSLMDPNHLYVADGRMPADERGWIKVPTLQRYPGAILPGDDVPVGMMRFHVASMAAFLRSTLDGTPYDPGIEQGARVQAVIEAAIQAARTDTWVDVPPIA